MAEPVLYTLMETPAHPDLSGLYRRLGIQEQRFASMRKAISQLKRAPPDIVVGEFRYGYGNNYAGANLSNLDVFLYSLQKYAPRARVIVACDKRELAHAERLGELFALHGLLTYPLAAAQLEPLLQSAMT